MSSFQWPLKTGFTVHANSQGFGETADVQACQSHYRSSHERTADLYMYVVVYIQVQHLKLYFETLWVSSSSFWIIDLIADKINAISLSGL